MKAPNPAFCVGRQFPSDDTPIILNLSNIAKPYAKKMDYLAMVRDGSSGVLVNG